jgi:methyl-accepting chemotaxis protein
MYKSLKSQLIVNNVAVLLVFGLIQFILFNNSQFDQRKGIRENFQMYADKVAENTSQDFYNIYHNVQAISKNNVLRTKSFEESNFLFNELMSLYKNYDFILLTDLEGNYVASNSMDQNGKTIDVSSFKGASFSNTTWFKETLNGKFTEDIKKGIFGSRFGQLQKSSFASKAYKKDRYGFHTSTQVTDEYGDPLAILTAFVSSDWLKSGIKSSQESLSSQGMVGARIELYNKSNAIISSITEGTKLLSSQSSSDSKLISERFKFLETNFWQKLTSKEEPLVAYKELTEQSFVSSLGWKVLVTSSSEEAFAVINSAKMMFSLSLFIALIFMSFFTYYISNRLSTKMQRITKKVTIGSGEVDIATKNISNQASLLSESTTDQAANLQQTVSSLTEISAMVGKNTAHSQNSKELSSFSRNSANSGVETIGEMITSIEDISSTNQDIVVQMNKNAVEMSDIIKVISNIEDKTKVINDIVFQTKLLSFNASVEAARAGEHGKGFSVVAEEVGNLAKTSGEAAKEIEDLLHKSISQVKTIVDSNKEKVESLVSTGVNKVEIGKAVAGKCKTALEEILSQSEELDKAIEDIASASIEQSKGIDEIAKAMEQLDVVTKNNSEIAKVVSNDTDSLNVQSTELSDASDELSLLIYGKVRSEDRNTSTVDIEEDNNLDSKNILKLKKKSESLLHTNQPNIGFKKVAGSDVVTSSQDDEWEDL